jgi:hypothetical protein
MNINMQSDAIHPTHSKKDLITLCEVFNIEIDDDMYDMRKNHLVEKLEKAIMLIDYIEPEEDYYFVSGIEELREYLNSPNQSKILTTTQRERMIEASRSIIQYCRSGYDLDTSIFTSVDDLIRNATMVSNHGDISTCRRALYLLRRDGKIRPSIEPVLSQKMKKQLERREAQRQASLGVMKISHGKFSVGFE